MITAFPLVLLALHGFFQAILARPSVYNIADSDDSAPSEQEIAAYEYVPSSGPILVPPSEKDLIRMSLKLTMYATKVLEMSPMEQDRLFVDTIPDSFSQALDMLACEVLLHQKIYAEHIAILEDMEANPEKHAKLASYIAEIGQTALQIYEDAQAHTAWCNLLIRYIGWIARNPNRQDVDRLFDILYNLSGVFQFKAAERFKPIIMGLPGVERLSRPGYLWLLLKFREVSITRALHIPRTLWFHDDVTPALRLYSRACHILLPFIPGFTKKRLFQGPQFLAHTPPIYKVLTLGYLNKRKLKYNSKSPDEMTFENVRAIWAEIASMPEFNIVKHWEDESVTDRDFQASFMKPLGSLKSTPVPAAITDQRGAAEKRKNRNKKRKQNQQQKQRQSQKELQKGGKSSITSRTPSLPVVDSEAESIPSEEDESGPSSHSISGPSTSAPDQNSIIETVSGPSNHQVIPTEVEQSCSVDTPIESSSSDVVVSEKAEDKQVETVESWEDELAARKARIALEEKQKAQALKVIRQERAEQERSARQVRLRRNMQAGPAKSTFRLGLNATELCLAFPNAFNLFLSNGNICTAKARRYQWVFDRNVVIKQKHMDFLCNLFNLEGGSKANLNFQDMLKAHGAIEKCLRPEGCVEDSRGTVFKWSHRFEINNESVAPLMKGVHPEHASSRFNHDQARALFDGGGFDPRFFIPQA